MSESQHQAALMRWARMQELAFPELRLLFAVPNGGARAKATAWRLKQEGVKAGVLDLCLPVPRSKFHGLYIEMKNDEPRGVLSAEQKWWIAALRYQGYHVVVAYGWQEAAAAILGYLGQTNLAQQSVESGDGDTKALVESLVEWALAPNEH